jgi:hypothetical protein
MPIKINLLAEALAVEDLRRRDPVKRAIYFGALLVVLALVWFSSILLVHIVESQQLSIIQQEIQLHTNDYSSVQIKLKKIADAQRKLDALQKVSNSRFLQGTLMNAFQQLHVPSVELTRLRVEQSYAAGALGTPSITNLYGVIPGRPATTVEHIVITLDAKDYSDNPGDQVNHFQDALTAADYFKANLNPTNGIRLANLSAPQSSSEGKPYVLFTVECRFPDISR